MPQTITNPTARRSPRRAAAVAVLLAVGISILAACDVPATPAGKLFDAWKAGTPSAATAYATNTAKTQIFSQAYTTSAGWMFVKCEGAAGSTYCIWVNKLEGLLILRVDNASQKVTSVERRSLGSVEAGRVFHAWRLQDKPASVAYSTATARNTLFTIPFKSSDHWLPDGCEGAAGSLYCTWYRDSGASITLRVSNLTDPKLVTETTGTIFSA